MFTPDCTLKDMVASFYLFEGQYRDHTEKKDFTDEATNGHLNDSL